MSAFPQEAAAAAAGHGAAADGAGGGRRPRGSRSGPVLGRGVRRELPAALLLQQGPWHHAVSTGVLAVRYPGGLSRAICRALLQMAPARRGRLCSARGMGRWWRPPAGSCRRRQCTRAIGGFRSQQQRRCLCIRRNCNHDGCGGGGSDGGGERGATSDWVRGPCRPGAGTGTRESPGGSGAPRNERHARGRRRQRRVPG